ncbi:MAG: type II toxin-antitoxin system RelE/ParE family toxin [Gemmatimonadota bacterium]|nr:type II toxin-antitoxin system RelE/ParE family toxin [Gemmatimonadota bacterium]
MPEDEEKYKVRFADETKKEFRKLGHAARVDILATIKKKLTAKPEEYGEPLVRELAGYRKLPVGQWRVVYYVEEGKILVLVLAVGKRAEGDSENIYDQITRADLDSRREELRQSQEEEKQS